MCFAHSFYTITGIAENFIAERKSSGLWTTGRNGEKKDMKIQTEIAAVLLAAAVAALLLFTAAIKTAVSLPAEVSADKDRICIL